jgi:ATP-dependent Clp endopeptidase proteolytic subunit ClpP
MSEENNNIRTTEEVQADVAKTLAEIDKINAETKKAEADTRKSSADAIKLELEARKAWRTRAREKASDEENHLYRFSGSVGAASVNKCMIKLTEWSRLDPKCNIEIVFSSPGGSIIDGFELFDFIQELRGIGHKVTTGTLGMAASMAGILLQAGDVRWVGHQAWVMIHRAHFGVVGKTYEIEDEVEFVKRIEERILDIFTIRSKLTKQKIKRNWDRKDWWISADEALELRLVDEIRAMLPEAKAKIKNPDVKKRKKRKKK